jgi:hypothetical protein
MKNVAEMGASSRSRIVCALMVGLGLTVAIDARQVPAPAPPIQVRVKTITAFAMPLAGQRVRVVDGVVRRVASLRLFILSAGDLNVPLSSDGEVAVILETGRAMLSPREHVIVTGVVRGSLAQQEEVGPRLIGALTIEERDALRNRPLIIVSSPDNLTQP